MRKYIMIALITLTVFRGWVGDAMAMEMAGMSSNAAVVTATASIASASMPCHGEATTSAEIDQTNAENCTACQACHSPALQLASVQLNMAEPIASHAEQNASYWASADLTHLQKPPVA